MKIDFPGRPIIIQLPPAVGVPGGGEATRAGRGAAGHEAEVAEEGAGQQEVLRRLER